jgi:hypothetical protein
VILNSGISHGPHSQQIHVSEAFSCAAHVSPDHTPQDQEYSPVYQADRVVIAQSSSLSHMPGGGRNLPVSHYDSASVPTHAVILKTSEHVAVTVPRPSPYPSSSNADIYMDLETQ